MRYYYKDNKGNLFNYKSEHLQDGYTQITEEEFEELTKPKVYEPTAEQKAAQEKASKIAEYRKYLADTDYIVLKIAEAQFEGETSTVSQLRDLYKEQLKERKRVRLLLN